MLEASRLAGFVGAQAMAAVSRGPTLTPILAYTTPDGERSLERFNDDDLARALAAARAKLTDNPMDAEDAVLAADARITLDGRKVDAVVLELRSFDEPEARAIIAVPYRPATSGRFRIHAPQLVEWKQCGDVDKAAAFQQFLAGIADNEAAAALWKAAFDPSA